MIFPKLDSCLLCNLIWHGKALSLHTSSSPAQNEMAKGKVKGGQGKPNGTHDSEAVVVIKRCCNVF